MELVADVHLEDWNIIEEEEFVSYTRGKIRIVENRLKKETLLQIQNTENHFHTIKKIISYWELRSLDIFLNDDITTDAENVEFQEEFAFYIRDLYADFEYLITNKITGHLYGSNNLFVAEGWNNEMLENMWKRGEIEVISLLEEASPQILRKKGWEEIEIQELSTIEEVREYSLGNL